MARPVVLLFGPTATGKTTLARDLAATLRGEVISADSRQIYRGLDIGTAKPYPSELRLTHDKAPSRPSRFARRPARTEPVLYSGIPHYLLDVLEPTETYSAAAFVADASRIITSLHRRRKLPIVVGGTGFYLRALAGDRPLPTASPDRVFRAWAARQPVEKLAAELQHRSSALFARVDHPRNRRRVTRFLEIARSSPQQTGARLPRATPPPWDILKLALDLPLPVLRRRIFERVEAMLTQGFVEEVTRLVARYGPDAPGLQTVGYREVLPVLARGSDHAELREVLVRAHWRTARRQRTWLKTEPHLIRVRTPNEAFTRVRTFLDALRRAESG